MTITGVESAECPVSMATPKIMELLRMESLYLTAKTASAPLWGADALKWPAWWADAVACFESNRAQLESEMTKAAYGD